MLARKLTYLCRRGDRYLAVTMDYGNIDRDAETDVVKLDVRELDGDAVVSALVPLRKLPGGAAIASRLVEGGPPTWTIATMSDLKPAASSIQLGRLQWILSTALPMSPAFQLRLNGRLVKSSVERRQVIAEWALGEGEHQLPQSAQRVRDADGPAVEIEGLAGVLRGTARVVTEVLTKNKASEWGRSHGFFVKVRRRLVNLDDPLFGVTALSHASFNRFRLEVNADGLDDFMASTRETIQDSAPVERFRNYLRAEFNHARQKFEDWSEDQNSAKPITDRINDTASSVSRAPLVHAVEMLVSGEVDRLLLIETPTDLGDQTETAFLDALHESLEEDDGEGLITAVELEPLGPDRFIASYDPCTRRVAVNTLHPFFANFIENLSQPQPFQMMAVAEVLSEAYLIEQGYDVADVAAFISRRDAFLRELVSAQREGPGLIAQNLIDNSASENGLEEAVTSAFANIGFTATRLSKAGRPDGFAVATLGVSSDDPEARRDDYSFTYDAKSTAASRVSTHTLSVSMR